MAYIWSETFSNMRHSGPVAILSIAVIVMTTIVVSALLIVANFVHIELNTLKQSPLMVAFLQRGVDDSSARTILKQIENLPQVYSVHYVSKEEALQRSRKMFSQHTEILEGLEKSNPLPASFEIELKAQYLGNPKALEERLRSIPGIEDVQYAEETSRLVRNVEVVLMFISLVLALASMMVICFSIIVTTYIRSEEIAIMRLVGATSMFIRIPLLLQGVMQAVIGSCLGIGILYGIFRILSVRIGTVSFLPLQQIAYVVGAAGLAGLIAGSIPLRRFIRI